MNSKRGPTRTSPRSSRLGVPYLLEGKAEAAQQTNPVEPRATSSAMYRRCCGGTCRRFQQSDVVIMVQRPDSKAGGFRDWPEPDRPEDFQAALDDAADISELEKSITPMALGMGALDQCHQEPSNPRTTRRSRYLETSIWQTAVLLRSHSMYRPGPVEERPARRSDVRNAARALASGALQINSSARYSRPCRANRSPRRRRDYARSPRASRSHSVMPSIFITSRLTLGRSGVTG